MSVMAMPPPLLQKRPVRRPRPSSSTMSAVTTPSVSTAPTLPTPTAVGKDTSSSSGTVFAKPSKEWVLPERAKPGRKAATDEPDNRRQSQNRLSQRAHRARRTDYIQTLEERLRQYEADEIHSNVRLQEVARALKSDNIRMKAEIDALRAAVASHQAEREAWARERAALLATAAGLHTAGPANGTVSPRAVTPAMASREMPRPSTLARLDSHAAPSSRAPIACPICPDPDPDCPCQRPAGAEPSTASCGLCASLDECLCVETKPDIPSTPVRALAALVPLESPTRGMEDHGCGLCTSAEFCACRANADPSPPTVRALIESGTAVIMASTGAVPLRLKSRAKKASLWTLDNVLVSPLASSPPGEAVCTGDPNNCDACRDDKFGRDFCAELFQRPATAASCAECPGKCMHISALLNAPLAGPSSSRTPALAPLETYDDALDEPALRAPLQLACCGRPELCGRHDGCAGEVIGLNGAIGLPSPERETMRPDEVWKTLKAHPNHKHTPLAILADVVARRAKVEGSRIELSPEPSSTSVTAGGKRRLEVETSAVRDALKLLDEAGPSDGREAKRLRMRRT
ncbi:hypothetical protein Q5752_004729 [Cryptotrichosporon argae]